MKLHPTQSIVAKDMHRFRICCNGRRWGKTTLAVEEIKGKAVYRESRIAYFAPTYQQARDIAWLMLVKQLQPVITKQNESRLELEIRNLKDTISIIQLRGWESVETARGQAFDFIVVDEIAMMRNWWSNWQEVLRPTLTDTRGEALFISTPKGFNHFYDLYNLQDKDQAYKSFHFTSYDNPWLPRKELDEARSQMTEDRFAQEYLADFRKTEGLVYKEFDRKYHIFEKEPQRIVEYLGGIDFGFTNPAAVIHIKRDVDDSYWITDEWYKTKRTEGQIADYVASCRFNKVYPDPENPSAIEVLNQKGISTVEVVKGKDSVKSGINKVRELLKQDRLHIHRSCVNLINEFETYSYPDKKPDRPEDEAPIKEHDHCLSGNTLIKMANGKQKKLKNVIVGELVKTQYGINKVLLSRLTRRNAKVYEIELSNGYKLRGTGDHKIYTNNGKIAIDALRYGDIIEVLENNKILHHEQDFAITIVSRKRCRQEDVYNLTIDKEHNYYANGILVANCLDALRYTIMGIYNTKIQDNMPMPQGTSLMSEDPYFR